MVTVSFDDLESAFLWVSGTAQYDNAAYISKATGQVFLDSASHETEDELPEDYEDALLYWTVPHKNELNLGRSLAFEFVEERLPDQLKNVQRIFHERGAYRRFKDLLDRKCLLDDWYDFERVATEAALLAWAKREGMNVTPPVPRSAA